MNENSKLARPDIGKSFLEETYTRYHGWQSWKSGDPTGKKQRKGSKKKNKSLVTDAP